MFTIQPHLTKTGKLSPYWVVSNTIEFFKVVGKKVAISLATKLNKSLKGLYHENQTDHRELPLQVDITCNDDRPVDRYVGSSRDSEPVKSLSSTDGVETTRNAVCSKLAKVEAVQRVGQLSRSQGQSYVDQLPECISRIFAASRQTAKEIADRSIEIADRSIEIADRSIEIADRSIEIADRSIEIAGIARLAIKFAGRSAGVDLADIDERTTRRVDQDLNQLDPTTIAVEAITVN